MSDDKVLNLLNRREDLFEADINILSSVISSNVSDASFLVVGAAGSIGKAVCREIFSRHPKKLIAVDISENNLVEMVRDLRSSYGYISGEFRTYALDYGSLEFSAMCEHEAPFDYVLNLAALKHVRSEKDVYTLFRMLNTNIFSAVNLLECLPKLGCRKYFCVSTDKAANPVNMMGASKHIMELFIQATAPKSVDVSLARFANVAFSDGSLLHGFNQRFLNMQPITAPNDVKRYFLTPKESGELCLMSALLGDHNQIMFPKLNEDLVLQKFSDIAMRFVRDKGFSPVICNTEQEARDRATSLIGRGEWPCYFFESNTTGEKMYEEFYTDGEVINFEKFEKIGLITLNDEVDISLLENFRDGVGALKAENNWNRELLVNLMYDLLPSFKEMHIDTGTYLDNRM